MDSNNNINAIMNNKYEYNNINLKVILQVDVFVFSNIFNRILYTKFS